MHFADIHAARKERRQILGEERKEQHCGQKVFYLFKTCFRIEELCKIHVFFLHFTLHCCLELKVQKLKFRACKYSKSSFRFTLFLFRSREARRLKENQIAMRAAYLEKQASTSTSTSTTTTTSSTTTTTTLSTTSSTSTSTSTLAIRTPLTTFLGEEVHLCHHDLQNHHQRKHQHQHQQHHQHQLWLLGPH